MSSTTTDTGASPVSGGLSDASMAMPTPQTASPSDDAELDAQRRLSRLAIPDILRIPLASVLSFGVGMGLGTAHGSTMAGMRFRAEHAHKLPQTTAGWYLYHKSKNYHAAFGGIREGMRMGLRVSFWTTAVFGIETLYDRYRNSIDLANTVLACVTVAGGFSLWNRFPMATAARTTRTAIVVGVAYGGLQDAVGLLRGRPVSYVEWVKGKFTDAE